MTPGDPPGAPHPRHFGACHLGARFCALALTSLLALLFGSQRALASDHADPIDPLNNKRLEPGITDLFVFPVDADGRVVAPWVPGDSLSLARPATAERPLLGPEVQERIHSLIVILCVRRQLSDAGSLRLDPYAYRINMDLGRTVAFDDEQKRARYGGAVARPETIEATTIIELKLHEGNGTVTVEPSFRGDTPLRDTGSIKVWSGVVDDPFILPSFFGFNVVGVALEIPITSFPAAQQDWIVWATSSKGRQQIDHVGRSSRTQNPRFDFLNTLPPKDHVAAIKKEHEHISLMRDIFLRFGIQSLFAFRAWDQVPDVMIYTRRFAVGFPNGRLLTDDVAARLAQFGDTLLFETSYITGGWPRQTINDKPFRDHFPYLAEPWPAPTPASPVMLSTKTRVVVGLLFCATIATLALAVWKVVDLVRRALGLAPRPQAL